MRSVNDVGSNDFHALKRICIMIGFQPTNFIQARESGDHYTENGVLSVLGWYRLEADIRLAPIRLPVWIDTVLQPARRDGTAKMFSPYFGWQCVTGTASAGHSAVAPSGEGIAALYQIIWEHSMNGGFLIKTIRDQFPEICCGPGGIGVQKSNRKGTHLSFLAFSPTNIEYRDWICQTDNR